MNPQATNNKPGLLRRLATSLKHRDWASVGIELFVVAIGIFLGLQVANWNDDRLERVLERDYLVRLHEDISASASGLSRDNGFHRQQLSDQKKILAALDACEYPPDDAVAIQRGINTLGWLNPPRLFRRTIDDLAATGRMNIIRSTEIKTELARLVQDVEFRDRVTSSVFRILEHHRRTIDERVRYDVSKRVTEREWPVAVEFDIKAMCDDPVIASAISSTSLVTLERLIAFEALLERYEDFLPLIEQELKLRWDETIASE
ncbi:MAG: hypothetical protein AAFQ99_04565 [Pseudomonadota bacterium]